MAEEAADRYLTENMVDNPVKAEEGVIKREDALALDIDKEKVSKIVDQWHEDYQAFFTKKYNLFERRQKNEMFLFGRQLFDREKKNDLKTYETRYLDNVLYEIEGSIKPLAMSRLPDLMVTPGQETQESKDTAKDISTIINTQLKTRENRTVAGIAFKHHPVYFVGVVKAIWDNKKKDNRFLVVHPDNIEVDENCNTNNADDMKWIRETLTTTVQEVYMRFPEAKEDFTKELEKEGLLEIGTEPSTKLLNSTIKISETWFTWYEKGSGKDEEEKWEQIEGVVWKFKKCVLKMIKNPNFDYEGYDKYFTYADKDGKQERHPTTAEEAIGAMRDGFMPDNIVKEHLLRNYFDQPKKPYYFIGYDQWRKIPYDETSRIEQNIRNQENLDKRGKSIIDKLSQRIKHIFSRDGGIRPKDMEEMDLDDPTQDILVTGKISEVHGTINPEQPTTQDFKDLDDTRNRMYSVAGANAIRGELQTDVATSNQIAREADYTRADDLVEDTINALFEWMGDWSMQFIKLRYTEAKFKKIVGARGAVTFKRIESDMVEDGMEVAMKASSTDKLKNQKQALEMAKIQFIDPLTFYEDVDASDPEGRAERLLTLQANPLEYLAKFVKKMGDNSAALAGALMGQNAGTPNQPNPAPSQPEATPSQPPANQQLPVAGNTADVPVAPPTGVPGKPTL